MARKKKEAVKEPVFSSESKLAVVNFGDRTVKIEVGNYDVKGCVELRSGEKFYFSSALM